MVYYRKRENFRGHPHFRTGATLNDTENLVSLEDSLMDLHLSVLKLIKVIQDNAKTLSQGEEILNKLPLLDFYNDDLLRNIEVMRDSQP